nr:Nicotinamide riboside transporter PnuC [Cupriavidus sp.]
MNLLEWLAAGLGLGGVLLGIAQKSTVWPLWIASSAIYVFIYAQLSLWGQVGLMVLFIGLSLWGLLQWRRQTAQAQTIPAWLGLSRWRTLLLLVAAVWLLMGVFLGQTENPHAWLDAWVTTTSLFAMGLMARRRLDCWLFWGAANASAVVLFAQQALWATTLLYTVQLFLSWWGFQRWRASSPGRDTEIS